MIKNEQFNSIKKIGSSDLKAQFNISYANEQFPKQFSHYVFIKPIARGSFGQVYLVEDLNSKKNRAIKIEIKKNQQFSSIIREVNCLQQLKYVPGIPQLIEYGTYITNEKYLVIDYLGSDLTKIQKNIERKTFSLKTTLMLGHTLLDILKNIHNRKILHRDLKPQNILVNQEETGKNQSWKNKLLIILVYLVDFGISKQIQIPEKIETDQRFIGTIRYASKAAHSGFSQCRKDELESLGYVLIYLYLGLQSLNQQLGKLPWSNILDKNQENKLITVGKKKLSCTISEICNGMPQKFNKYFSYIEKLEINQTPNYSLLQNTLKQILNENKLDLDYEFDWNPSQLNFQFKKSIKKIPCSFQDQLMEIDKQCLNQKLFLIYNQLIRNSLLMLPNSQKKSLNSLSHSYEIKVHFSSSNLSIGTLFRQKIFILANVSKELEEKNKNDDQLSCFVESQEPLGNTFEVPCFQMIQHKSNSKQFKQEIIILFFEIYAYMNQSIFSNLNQFLSQHNLIIFYYNICYLTFDYNLCFQSDLTFFQTSSPKLLFPFSFSVFSGQSGLFRFKALPKVPKFLIGASIYSGGFENC